MQYPTLTTLTGQEFYALRQTGCYPIGFAVGASVYRLTTFMYSGNSWMRFSNQEMTEYSRAFHAARTHAMRRIEASALTLGGTGVVDMVTDYDPSTHEVEVNEQHGLAITVMFLAYGTIIADAGWKSNDGPSYCVTLQDPPHSDKLLLGK